MAKARGTRVRYPVMSGIFYFATASIPALGPTTQR